MVFNYFSFDSLFTFIATKLKKLPSNFSYFYFMKKLFILISFFFLQKNIMAQDKPQLIYFGDPMCSWCYGFSPEISTAVDSLGDSVDFQMIMGGLRPYNTETMADLGDFLKDHWKEVAEKSGQPFSYDIISDHTFIYDTEPACRAVVVMKKLQSESTLAFFKKIQHSFYAKNKNTNSIETYLELVEAFGIEKAIFQKEFESDEMKAAVKSEFTYSSEIGVRGFPTIVLQKDGKFHLISNGYTSSGNIIENCRAMLK